MRSHLPPLLQMEPYFKTKELTSARDITESIPIPSDGEAILKAHQEFTSTLLKPECALLVQGMRNLLGGLHSNDDLNSTAKALQNYLHATLHSLSSHIAWRDKDIDETMRRSLESFLYAQAHPILDSLPWGGLFSITEDEWTQRLSQLQFLTHKHLEITCWKDDPDWLNQPVDALLSVHQFYAPFEKLQRILRLFQTVNAALSSTGTVPSADDVLPTIIVTVLKAKPRKIFQDLQHIEVFCPPEYLRGEAGYAYTNLYGAVQFLVDLNMERPDSLSIAPDEFQKGIEASMAATRTKVEALQDAHQNTKSLRHRLPSREPLVSSNISPQQVRAARLRGETIHLEWALQLQRTQKNFQPPSTSIPPKPKEFSFPKGFSRSYTYLNTRPEDVRFSDVPLLLEEYKTLTRVTEDLWGTQMASMAALKKWREEGERMALDDSFFQGGVSDKKS